MRFLLFFLLFITTLNAQEKDTLSSISYNNLKTLINSNIRSNPKTAIFYSEYLLKIGLENNDLEKQCLAHSYKGNSYRVLGDIEKALEEQLKAKALLNNVKNPQIRVRVYNSLGNTYSDKGIYDSVLPNYFEAIKIADANNLIESSLSLKNNLAYFKSQIGEQEEAISILKQSNTFLDSQEGTDNLKPRFSPHNNMLLAMVYSKLNKPDSTIYYVNKSLPLKKKQKDKFSTQGLYCYLGIAYSQKGDFDQADLYLKKSDSLGVEMGNDIVLMGTKYAYASMYFKMKNYHKVISILENSIKITEEKKLNYENNDDNYNLIAKAYKELGDYINANLYFEKYIEKYNQNKTLYNIIDNSFEEKRIESFKNELQVLKKDNNKQSQLAKYGFILLSAVIAVLLIILLKFYRNKKQNELKFQKLLSKFNTSDSKTNIVDTKDEVLEESTSLEVSEEVKQQILAGLQKLEAQNYFLKQECNSYNVAKKIKTNTSYLSKVINAHYQKNFNTYINDLRINYAIVRLKNNSRFRSFSIQSIAEEVGYKSADSFAKYFKQHTDLNPSFYIKQLNNLD